MKRAWFVLLLAFLVSCHLALGLEEATEVEGSTSGGAGNTGCSDATACDDDNACTDDSCVDAVCRHDAIADGDAPGAMQVDGDCKRVVCSGGVQQIVEDGVDLPNDDNSCTDDVCAGDTPDHPPVAGGTVCSTGVCSGAGSCVECFDNAQCTAPESCGGLGVAFECGCTPTVTCGARTCGAIQDPVCLNAVICDNDVMDGGETDVDCGGSPMTCSVRCNEGEMCVNASDCGVDINMNPLTCPAGTCVAQ